MEFIREKMAEKELSICEDNESNGHFIQGLIIGRRSLGRNLSFADIAITQSAADVDEANNNDAPINIIFTRQSFVGPKNNVDNLNEPFPTKVSSLPFSASIIARLGHCQKVKSKISGVIEDVWEVTRWKITEHPKEMAEDMASLLIDSSSKAQNEVDEQSSKHETNSSSVIIGSGAMSCSDYLKARAEAFEVASKRKQQLIGPTKNQTRLKKTEPNTNSIHPENKFNDIDSEFNHGGKQAKAKRAKIFASWILETFFGIQMSTDAMIDRKSVV